MRLRPVLALAIVGLVLPLGSCSGPGTPATLTVNGSVVDRWGEPAASMAVLVGSAAAVTTDAAGHFSVAGVQAPYDVHVIDAANARAVSYLGVDRPDPTLAIWTATATAHVATVAGTLSGTFTGAPGDRAVVVFLTDHQLAQQDADVTNGGFSLSIGWRGAAGLTGTLCALRLTTSAGGPTGYVAYGCRSGVMVSAGGISTNQDVTLSPIGSQQVSGTLQPPSGFALVNRFDLVLTPEGGSFTLHSEGSPGPAFQFATPQIAGAHAGVASFAARTADGATSEVNRVDLAPDGIGLAVAFDDPVTPVLPVVNATGVTEGSQFSWSGASGRVVELHLRPSASSTGPEYYVYSADDHAAMPDLSAAGMGLPASQTYVWSLRTYAPPTTIDTLTAPDGPFAPGILYYGEIANAQTESTARSLTTAP